MKIAELFEMRDQSDPQVLSKEDFDNLQDPSPANIENCFKVQNVAFDQEKGMGSTPNNRNVKYLGFVMELKPSTFLQLALDADRSDDAKKFVGFIRKHAPLASPTYYVKVNEKEYLSGEPLRVAITGHEGRGRMWAIDELNGNTPTPVHIILDGGMRARDLNEKFFEDLRNVGLISEREKTGDPQKIPIGRIFWNGKTL